MTRDTIIAGQFLIILAFIFFHLFILPEQVWTKLAGNNQLFKILYKDREVVLRAFSTNDMLVGSPKKARLAFWKLDEAWQDAGNKPLIIISAYRPAWKNKIVGGARLSRHLKGDAFDLHVIGMPISKRKKLIRLAMQHGFKGFGIGATRLHIDMRPKIGKWGYVRSSGGGTIPEWAKELF